MKTLPAFDLNKDINQTTHVCIENAFDATQLGWIDNLKNLFPVQKASTVGNNDEIRKSSIRWIHFTDKSQWVYEKLAELATQVNKEMWNFNLHTIVDSIQYTEYYEGGGHYGWHVDIGPGTINHRKISITVQLSAPNEYEGGDFEMWTGGNFKTLPRQIGCAVMFPSFLLHRVTPVTKGTRKSLVLWVGGESYK